MNGGDGAIHIPDDMGSDEHRRLLRAMAGYIARQPWALAFIVFGSVARGNWGADSDLDLDVVVTPQARLFAVEEAERMCAAMGEVMALTVARNREAAEVVLESLAQFSIRYHPLSATSPNILESAHVVWGDITRDDLGLNATERAPGPETYDLLALAVRALLNAQGALARGRLWSALDSLTETREWLLTLYAEARGQARPKPAIDLDSDTHLMTALARLVPTLEPAALRDTLLAGLDLLESDALVALSRGQARLTDGERAVLVSIRARLRR